MDPERKPATPRAAPETPAATPAELLTVADARPHLAAAYAEWLNDRAGDQR